MIAMIAQLVDQRKIFLLRRLVPFLFLFLVLVIVLFRKTRSTIISS